MAGRDNVTFVFSIENRKFMVKGKQMGAMLTEIQRSGTAASKGLQTVGNEGQNAGTKMAASAVNFQTATQGMLNLSTAAVQTFTSISNLDRANNRAKMSIIAVARAEDLLNNKETRLNDLRAQGITSGEKYRNMQREIATATADLTVKQEKQKIEQDAVNDVYMLFATNIANVTISSLQTVGVLLGQEKMARLGVTVATKLQSLALSRNVTVTVASKAATGGHVLVSRAMTFAQIKQTFATKGLTAATMAFTRAAWPLLAVTAAVTAAYLIYENNIGGVKDGIDSLMGVEKTHMDVLEEERNEIDLLNDSLDTHTDKIFRLPQTYAQAAEDLKKLNNQIKESNEALKESPLFREASVAGGNTTATGFSILPMAFADHGGAHYDHQFDRFQLHDRFANYLDTMNVREMDQPLTSMDTGWMYGKGSGKFNTSGKVSAFSSAGRPLGSAGTKIQEDFLEFERKSLIEEISSVQGIPFFQAQEVLESGSIQFLPNDLQGRINIHFQKSKAVIERLSGPGFVENEIEQATILSKLKQFTPESYALDQHRDLVKQQLQEIKDAQKKALEEEAQQMGLTVQDLQRRRGLSGKQIFVEGVGFVDQNELKRTSEAKSTRRLLLQGDLSSLPTDTVFDRLIKDTFLSSHKNSGLSPFLRQGSLSGKIYDTEQLNLMFASKDFSPSRKAAYDKYGVDIGKVGDRLSKEDAERIGMLQRASKEFQGIGGRGDAAIQFFGGSATAAYQVPRGSIRASDEFYARIAEQDRIANLKRFGGYSSRKAQSEAGKAAFYSSVDEASRMMRFFGDQINSSVIRGRSSRRSEYGRIATKGAMYKSALASAGLGYKTINTRLGSRPDNWRILQFNRDLAEIISYNTNQYAKAETINILQQDFGLTGFTGTTMSLPSLQDRLAAEDERMKSIGLTRTEAFQIVDTAGRGREEIDDRVRFKDRLSSMSTGVSVL
jgi:hypothetical protein